MLLDDPEVIVDRPRVTQEPPRVPPRERTAVAGQEAPCGSLR